MFFQFSPPIKKVDKKVAPQVPDEPEILSLAPFTKNPKICFDNVPVGTEAVRILRIQNPLNQDLQIAVKFDIPEEIGAELSWLKKIIKKNEECELKIIWIPKNQGAWRQILHLGDENRILKNIPVAFKSVIPKKSKSCKSRTRTNNCLPKFKTKSPNAVRKKSPIKSPKKRFVLPNITNLPNVALTNYENEQKFFIKSDDKENLNCALNSNFNWECDITQVSRRNTYVVQNAVVKSNIVSPASEPKFVDSLELDLSPHNENNEDIITKLGSTSFPLSPVTPHGNYIKFEPSLCSTDEKSCDRSCLQIHSFGKNTTFQIMSEINEKANITPDIHINSHIKENNLSTETYVKANLSSETYTKADISSSTYVKDNSSIDVPNLQFSPLTNDFNKSTTLSEDIFFEESSLRNCKDKHALLSCIIEESWASDTSTYPIKRKSNVTFEMTPRKRVNLGITDWSKKGRSPFAVSKKSLGLNRKIENNGKLATVTSTNIKEIKVKDPFLATAINNVDPFMASTIHYDSEWMDKQQENFRKWLNALLTPCELDSNEENHLDIEKIWEQCKKKENVLAPTKEMLSCKFHTNSKLTSLRKSALLLFKSENVQSVLCNVMKAVEADKLTVRQDRDILLDLFLQSEIMSVILSYNSLWLRIGLETIYGEIIPMNSNSDLMALSNFILERFFKDQYLLKKHKTVHSVRYCKEIKKIILKKFLTLVFFLDKAKTEKLIQHDPCLFRKNSHIKESREMLLKFAREALLAVGDITKYLKHFGYFVQHKQTYIDEFDYAVKTLGVDLRDGVRLTRICEIMLLRNDLSKNLRVPAVSRLQKVHNVKIVFDALEQAGFQICGDISPKDIVDGHKEKTLSFLWQIIYKFQAPLLIKCATSIQNWWRSMPIMLKRNQLRRNYRMKDAAARKIQLWYKKLLFLRKLEQFIEIVKWYIEYRRRCKSAVVIQSYIRMYLVRKRFLKLRSSVVKLQEFSRIWLASEQRRRILAVVKIQSYFRMLVVREKFRKLKANVLLIEERYLAYKLMRLHRERFENLKYMTIQMQSRFRAKQAGKIIRQEYLILRKTIISCQQRWRAKFIGRRERSKFLLLKNATLIIQQRYRAKIIGRNERDRFESLKKAVLLIQKSYRAKVIARRERSRFLALRKSATIIQQFYRATKAMRTAREEFLMFRRTVIMVQERYRATRKMKHARSKFLLLRRAALTIQQRYRSKLLGRIERAKFASMKIAAVTIQQRYRAKILGKIERDRFESLKKAVLVIQKYYRAKVVAKRQRNRFLILRKASITIQQFYRATKAMRTAREEFLIFRKTVIMVQERYRATRKMRHARSKFLLVKKATLIIQQRYRSKLIGRIERARFTTMKIAAVTIQQRYRAKILGKIERDRFKSLKKAVLVIQKYYKAEVVARRERNKFLALRKASIIIQQFYRATKAMKRAREEFLIFRKTVIKVQERYRATRKMRHAVTLYQKMRSAAITIQRYYRHHLKIRAVILIQKYVRRFLVLQRYGDYLKPEAIQERRKQRLAAAKIWAFWKGYKTRVNEKPEISEIRKKIEKANENALPQNTLGYRCRQAVLLLSSGSTVSEIIRALEDIGFLTRRCKSTCLRMSSSLSRSLYVTITSTNRSPPEMKACTAATNILIDFYRYPPSRKNSFIPEFIDKLITVMLHWCDKEAPLFLSLCTLIWLFCHSREYKSKILESPNFWQKMSKMEALCTRREKMVGKVNTKVSIFLPRRNLPIPSLKSDWGLELENRPKTFCNSVYGLQCLLRILRE